MTKKEFDKGEGTRALISYLLTLETDELEVMLGKELLKNTRRIGDQAFIIPKDKLERFDYLQFILEEEEEYSGRWYAIYYDIILEFGEYESGN